MNEIGLDVGTSGVKSTVFGFGKNSGVISAACTEYELICMQPGMFEFDSNIILEKDYRSSKSQFAKAKRLSLT